MSTNFFFAKWKDTMNNIHYVIDLDLEYLKTKAHDKTLNKAVARLSAVLAEYINVYNKALDCYRNNLQVQKTTYMAKIINAIVARITELKRQLTKLEGSNYQYLNTGLITRKLTTHDVEYLNVPVKVERSEEFNKIIRDSFVKAQVEIERVKDVELEEFMKEEEALIWWEADDAPVLFVREKVSEGTFLMRQMVNLIGAHERTRQVIKLNNHKKIVRQKWIRELENAEQPEIPEHIKERASSLIKEAFRMYFELKRKKIRDCKRDELLDIRRCTKPSDEVIVKSDQICLLRGIKYKPYDDEAKATYDQYKAYFYEKRSEDIIDDIRDKIRDWFQEWFNEIHFIHDIPNEKQGGSLAIFRDEIPPPAEWLEQYKQNLIQELANKGKSPQQLKQEKQEKQREAMMLKKEAAAKKKLDELLLKKMMKNPKNHPGYHFPESKKIDGIIKAIEEYHKEWYDIDMAEEQGAKENIVKARILDTVCMDVKLEIIKEVDEHMRQEFKSLKHALKKDYETNNEKMPEEMNISEKGPKVKKLKAIKSENLPDKLMHLGVKGILKEYPKTELKEFIGDPNFVGEDIRKLCLETNPFYGETRQIWWERCRELVHGPQRVLLIGAHGSGKKKLVHIMATLQNAVLFEINLSNYIKDEDNESSTELQQIANSLIYCARAAQPTVIYMKDVHKLFYRKVPPEDPILDVDGLKKFFIKKLFKAIQRTDNITVIGSCVDPWLTNARLLVKQFPNIVLMPNTCYSVTVQVLKAWVMNNRCIPRDLNVGPLAQVLQGYSFGYIEQALRDFLTEDRIVKMAAFGLNPNDILQTILNDENAVKVEYEKYSEWYFEKTSPGVEERKLLKQQKEFQELTQKYAEKDKKKPQSAPGSTSSSFIGK